VLALGRFYGGVHLAAWKWLAIAGVVWLGALTFAALAVALGVILAWFAAFVALAVLAVRSTAETV
jgi:hypothetical protein